MKRRLRRQICALQAFAGGASFALVALLSMGLAQPNAPQRIDELTVPASERRRCERHAADGAVETCIGCTRAMMATSMIPRVPHSLAPVPTQCGVSARWPPFTGQ